MSRYAITSIVFLSLFIGSISLDGVIGIPLAWYAVIFVVYIAINVYGSFVLSAQYFVPVRSKANVPVDNISITFDDGPIPGKTERILEILKQHNVESAFFCIGHRVKENPGLVKRIHAEGHLIGNHSYWHGKTFDLLPANRVAKELTDTNAIIHDSIGLSPKFFRPPYGITNPMVAGAANRMGFIVVGWSVRSFDTIIKDKSRLFRRVTKLLKAGDIVLFHDYCESTVEMLPDFLQHVSGLGLKIVRVDKLLNEKAYG